MWISKRSKELALSHAQLESVILERTAELQVLSQRLLKVQDDERRKLARDLHDSTGQTLAALKITVSFLETNCKEDADLTAIVAELKALADQASDEIRTMSYLLHPPLLDEVGFACAADWFIEGFAKRSHINVRAELVTVGERLPSDVEIVLFRILQEALTNAHRHSGTSDIDVRFERHSDAVSLEVRDFGCGISADRLVLLRGNSAEGGVGLAGMRERLNPLYGKFEIESEGHGTTIRATIPLGPMRSTGATARTPLAASPIPANAEAPQIAILQE